MNDKGVYSIPNAMIPIWKLGFEAPRAEHKAADNGEFWRMKNDRMKSINPV
jgi:hypothetical protein